MDYIDFIAHCRRHWRGEGLERFKGGYWIGYAALHGLAERLTSEQQRDTRLLHEIDRGMRKLREAPVVSDVVVPVFRNLFYRGVDIPVADGHEVRNLSLENIDRIASINGCFGYVSGKNGKGHEIMMGNGNGKGREGGIMSEKLLDGTKFPEEYRVTDAGICWVEYKFDNRPPMGRLEPACALDFED